MTYYYSLTRTLDDGSDGYSTTVSISDRDAVNCAHMVANGFNTMSRNFTVGWVLGVVNPETGEVQYDGKIEKFDRPDTEPNTLRLARSVLESAYNELQDVKAGLEVVGVETIPASKGVRTLIRRLDHEEHARQAYEEANGRASEAARAELIEHVKRAYAKWGQVDPGRQREGLKSHLRGMLEVLSKYLVAIGEADADERHAVALRVCAIPEGNYLYDDA